MEYNTYIEDQILEMYIDQMDEVVEAFESEMVEFESILEAEGTELSTDVNTNKTSKLKALYEKLKPYLEKFIEAFSRIVDIVKTRLEKLLPLLAGKFKIAGKAEDDISILKYDAAKTNATTINTIFKDLDNQVLKPIDSGQNPKTNTLDDFRNKFDEVEYNKFVKEDNNIIQFKKGAVIRNNTFTGVSNASADVQKLLDESKPRSKEFQKDLNSVIPQVERANNDVSDNLKLHHDGLYFGIKLYQNMARYGTKLVDDLGKMTKNCEAVS